MTITTEGVTSVIYGATDLAGSVEPPRVLAIRLDRTAPGIHFSGADAYTADQVVTIGCTASDLGSGLAADPCTAPLIQQPAYSLDPGAHKVSAQANDKAGYAASAEFAFTVAVTFDSAIFLLAHRAGGEIAVRPTEDRTESAGKRQRRRQESRNEGVRARSKGIGRKSIHTGEGGYSDPLGRVFVTRTRWKTNMKKRPVVPDPAFFPLCACDYEDQEFNEISLRKSDES
jgi:hypothetical protein